MQMDTKQETLNLTFEKWIFFLLKFRITIFFLFKEKIEKNQCSGAKLKTKHKN